MIEIRPLIGIAEIVSGDDLTAILGDAMVRSGAEKGDILVITQKIFSKAEGRLVDLSSVIPGVRAREIAVTIGKDARLVELALSESISIVRAVPGVLITRHRLGFVMANAGIDMSNAGPEKGENALLLPVDPQASLDRLADALQSRLGYRSAIIMSDSFGRPWRNGVTNVAIASSGIPALHDRRGELDRDGRTMQVTQIAYGDLIASAAGLVMGEAAEGIPASLVRGLILPDEDIPAHALIRPVEQDLFA
jgi:coenzyme F420-0:L-glutamate ligase / coenzyme F420-1:gamma-L-glutamate ligase